MKKTTVAIIGCGTAGAAAALFLSRAGHDVTVFERVLDPQAVGAGVMIQPSGLSVLERLGCHERVLDRGARVSRLLCENERNVAVVDLPYASLGEGLYGVGLHRGVLFETLFTAVAASSAKLRCGVGIARTVLLARGGRTLITDEGEAIGHFDWVVVCDGARSHVRDSMPEVSKTVTRYPWGALWFIGDDPEDHFGGRLHQKVSGTRGMVGMLPTGQGPGPKPETKHTSLFFSVRGDEVDGWRARGLSPWKHEVLRIAPEAAPLLLQIHDMDQLTFATYFDVTMPRWHAPAMVFLGDAAHATSPQLGQGCNLALCDAAALADAVSETRSISEALEAYTARRREHLRFYQIATRWLTPLFQSDLTPLAWARDLLMSRSSMLGFVEREMVRSMCGTKTGFIFGRMPTRVPS